MNRATWLEYFTAITLAVATRSTCTRRKVGAIAVRDKRILATGYNGAPRGVDHCLDSGCLRDKMGIPSGQRHELCRGLHAEQNVIIQAALHGIRLEGADLYCTHQPCLICTKMLINCGVRKISCLGKYPDEMAIDMLHQAGVELAFLEVDA